MSNKHLIIYHAISPGVACDDGFAAALVAHNRLSVENPNSFITVYEGIYGKIPNYDLIDPDMTVHILDFSYPTEVLNVIAARAEKVILLDHHKSAMERWEKEKGMYAYNDRDIIFFDMNYSGAMLAWKHYCGGTPPVLINHVQDYDLWKFALPETKTIVSNLRSYPQTSDAWNKILGKLDTAAGFQEFYKEGEAINRYYNMQLQQLIAYTKEPCQILNEKGFCCNAPKQYCSDIGNILAKESGTFGASWFKKSDGIVEWSLRSIGDYDVSKLAKAFGGGGHKNAAGFSLHPDDIDGSGQNGITIWQVPSK